MNIWQKLQKKSPFFVLAPMDDVTDTVFRQIVKKHAPADLMMTEFANADGYCSPGKEAIEKRLHFKKIEQPLIAQIWGINPENYFKMSKDLVDMGFVGIDINMGCPVKDVVKKGSCSAMIKNPALAAEVITATQEGAAGKIPVSVKTRLGFDKIQTEEWIGFLLSRGLDAITVHGRTKKEMSKVAAHWDEIGKAASLRNEIAPATVVVGNGDVLSRQQGEELAARHGVDGIMIGRGIFRDLFVFADPQVLYEPKKMLVILREHIELYQQTWGDQRSYEPLKKFYKLYVNGFDGASHIRAELMSTNSSQQALDIINKLV